MKKIIFTLIIGLSFVGNCYGDDDLFESGWRSKNENMECTVIIDCFQECSSGTCLSIYCDTKIGKKCFEFPTYDLVNSTKNLSIYGDEDVIFWEIKKGGKYITLSPQNVNKMKNHKVKFNRNDFCVNNTQDISLFDNVIQQIPKMKFVKIKD